MNINYLNNPYRSGSTSSPDPSTGKNTFNWRKSSKTELETCIANYEKPVYGFAHMSFGDSFNAADMPDFDS